MYISNDKQDNPYENLRDAIITKAVQDYYSYIRAMLRHFKSGNKSKSLVAYYRAIDVKKWFLSADFEDTMLLKNGREFARLMDKGLNAEEKTIYKYWEDTIKNGNTKRG